MAFGGMGGGMGGRGSRGRYKPLAEINVTPLVDVMLVLLIVFMVAAPLMTSGVTVDLPKASAAPLAQDSEPVTISINAEGKIFLDETELALDALTGRLSTATEGKLDRRVFVRGDKGVPYGRVMEVMALATQAGYTKVALLVEQSGGQAAPRAVPTPAPTAAPVPAPTAAPVPARR